MVEAVATGERAEDGDAIGNMAKRVEKVKNR